MGMKRCEGGHYFDTSKHTSCPLCGIAELKLVASAAPLPGHTADDGKTVAFMKNEIGIDPVVGWLVCVQGPDRGSDYRIKAEKNFVGRNQTMDICISRDPSISRDNHAAVSFNPKNRSFKLLPGEGRGLVYLNGGEVDSPREINEGDRIEIGQSTLMFIPLCGEKFDWEREGE